MITFAIPTWNRVDKLEVCLSSLIEQIKQVPEKVLICVYNNASDDGTDMLLKELQSRYPEIISYIDGEVHQKHQESFKRAFLMPETEWMWMFGDDDVLAPNGLRNIIDILKRKDVDFIHAAEATRVGVENKTYYATAMELCCGFGFTEMTGFISGNICRTKKLHKAIHSEEGKYYQDCSFYQSLIILDAFSDCKAAFVNAPVIDLQERIQSNATVARWDKEDISLHYAEIGLGLNLLCNKGVIKGRLPEDFFRYLTANLFTKILYNFYDYSNAKKVHIDEKYWDMVYSMAELTVDEKMKDNITNFKKALHDYVENLQVAHSLLVKIQEAHDPCTNTLYPETYI